MATVLKDEFTNERGNAIELVTARGEAEEDGTDYVDICLKGPTSVSSNTITLLEAQRLHRHLSILLQNS